MNNRNKERRGYWVKDMVVVVITIIWALSFICDIVISGYEVSPYIHLIMMAIVGYLFADKIKR